MRPALILVLLFLFASMGLVRIRHSATSEKPEVKPAPPFASSTAPQIDPRPGTGIDDLTIAQHIVQQRDERLLAIRVRARWFPTHAEVEEIARSEAEAIIELKKLNVPEDQIRAMNDASERMSWRRRIADQMHFTEAEAAAHFEFEDNAQEIRRWFDELYSREMTEEEAADVKSRAHPVIRAEDQNLQSLREALGEERFREYKGFQTPLYGEARAFAERYNLDPSVADDLANLGKRWVDERFEIVSKHTPRNEIESILEANLQAHRATIERLVGADAARIYISDSLDTWWLKQH